MVSEIKFQVPADRIEALRGWARARLNPDPFGAGPHADTYQTHSIYFDTPAFDVFFRRGSFGRSKYRIRRYGDSGEVFLERKLKTRDRVSKRRSAIAYPELERLAAGEASHGWAGHWFHRRLLARALDPVCQVAYTRTALVHANGHGPIRMTLDVDVRAAASHDLSFCEMQDAAGLTGSNAILELKYHYFRPPVFEELIERFELIARPISKYRLAVGELFDKEVAA